MRRLFTLAFLAALPFAHADVQAFLTSPDIHGDKAVFTAEGDLWLSDVTTGVSKRLTSDPGLETRAHFSPDGNHIAFSANYEGGSEVYVMPVEGGLPKRLTYDASGADVLGWTPDGTRVLFRTRSKMVASLVGSFAQAELFTVSVNGGSPTKVAVPTANFAEFAPNGHTLAFVPNSNEWMNWFRYEGGEADEIWTTNLEKGTFEKLTHSNDVDTQPVWLGDKIYFISERTGIRNLYRLDPTTKKVTQVTFSTTVPVRNPSSDGKRVIYEIGPRIGMYDPAAGTGHVLDLHLTSDRIHARPFHYPVAALAQPDISPSGKRLVVVARGHLVSIPVEEGVAHHLAGAGVQRIQNPAWSPDGKKVAYTSDLSGEEELYTVDPVEGSLPHQVTHGLGGELYSPVWSPDGKFMVIGDRQNQVRIVEIATGTVKLIGKTHVGLAYDASNSDYDISPDSKWVAYQLPQGPGIAQVNLYEVATGKVTALTNPNITSNAPAFSADGKWLYILQARDINPSTDPVSGMLFADNLVKVTGIALSKDVKSPFLDKNEEESDATKEETPADGKKMTVDLEGIQNRLVDMKVPAGRYAKILPQGGRLLLLNATTPPIINGPTNLDLDSFDISKKAFSTLESDVAGVELSADGKKLLVAFGGGAQVVDSGVTDLNKTMGAVTSTATVTIDPESEWKQIFEESWRVARDFFYDPNMHGANWKAIRTKYEAELPLIGSRSDLTKIQAELISELNSGHCYVGAPPEFVRRGSQVGLLGADLAWDPTAHAYKIAHIYHGDDWDPSLQSPLSAQGISIKEGEYLLKIDGIDLAKDQDPAQLLLGKVGSKISVTVNSNPTLTGADTYTITPIGSESELRHAEWVQGRRNYVAKATGGKIGYVYISDMEDKGARDFAHDYYGNVEKPGIIFDVRGNGGGFTADQFFAQIATKQTGFFSSRNGDYMRVQNWAPFGHLAAVTDQWAFSDGEWFSEFWKRLALGPLVGHRTGGGCVGSGGGYALVDGGSIFIPNYGAFTASGSWVIEGRGTVPDYEVDQDPAALMAGKDPQLDKTIELLMAEIAKHPVTLPVHPEFPVKTHGSREGYKN